MVASKFVRDALASELLRVAVDVPLVLPIACGVVCVTIGAPGSPCDTSVAGFV